MILVTKDHRETLEKQVRKVIQVLRERRATRGQKVIRETSDPKVNQVRRETKENQDHKDFRVIWVRRVFPVK